MQPRGSTPWEDSLNRATKTGMRAASCLDQGAGPAVARLRFVLERADIVVRDAANGRNMALQGFVKGTRNKVRE